MVVVVGEWRKNNGGSDVGGSRLRRPYVVEVSETMW